MFACSGRCEAIRVDAGFEWSSRGGDFSANTARLTTCRAGDRVADSERSSLNSLFAGEGLGQPNFAVYSWQAVFAPAGIPKAVLSRLNTAVNNSLKSPALSKLLADQGMESRPTSPEAMQEFIAKEKVSMGDSVKIMKSEKAR